MSRSVPGASQRSEEDWQEGTRQAKGAETWWPPAKGRGFPSVRTRSGSSPNKGRVTPTENEIKGGQSNKAHLCEDQRPVALVFCKERVYITGLCVVPDKREQRNELRIPKRLRFPGGQGDREDQGERERRVNKSSVLIRNRLALEQNTAKHYRETENKN